jgi:hypothetical protein
VAGYFGSGCGSGGLLFDETKQTSTSAGLSAMLFFTAFVPFKSFLSNALFPGDAQIAAYWSKALLIIPGHIVFNYAINILLWKRRKGAKILLQSVLQMQMTS